MKKLEGKTAIITGASSGFGRGTAYAFAAEGCNLVLTARRKERLQETAAECGRLGAKAVWLAGDAIDEQTALAVSELAVRTFGRIDILVNNAGIGKVKPFTETTMADYDLIMDSNVRSAFAFAKAVVLQMLKQKDGQIILVSSVTGIKGQAGETAYSCSKFALRGFGHALIDEYLDRGIRTCVFCPHAGMTEFEIGEGRDAAEWATRDFLTPSDVGQALLSVAVQDRHSYIAELRLASSNVKFIC